MSTAVFFKAEMIREIHRRFLTIFFGMCYRCPLVFRLLHDIVFGKTMHNWRALTARYLPPNAARVLEVGCGMFPVISEGVVVDNSRGLLSQIPRNASLEKVWADARDLPFANASFDAAIAIFPPGVTADKGFFHEEAFWDEMRRVLMSHGRFITALGVEYAPGLWKLLSRAYEPPPKKDFWEYIQKVSSGMRTTLKRVPDEKGNNVLVLVATKNPPT